MCETICKKHNFELIFHLFDYGQEREVKLYICKNCGMKDWFLKIMG